MTVKSTDRQTRNKSKQLAKKLTKRKVDEEAFLSKKRFPKLPPECPKDEISILEKENHGGISMKEILLGIVNMIPTALRYPERACACIRINEDEQEFKTINFKETICKLCIDIMVHGEPAGSLVVCYLEEISEHDAKGFSREERAIIKAIAGYMERIFQIKHAEEALLRSENRFHNLVESLPIGIFIVQNDQIVYENPELAKYLTNFSRLFVVPYSTRVYPDDVEKFQNFFKRLIAREERVPSIEFRFYSSCNVDAIRDLKWVCCQGTWIEYCGNDAILVSVIDLTKIKGLENLLRIEDKMTSLGRVAAGMAHEVRNPLSTINVYLNILNGVCDNQEFLKTEGLEKMKESLAEIGLAAKKIEAVIKRVMDFARPSELKLILADVNQCIESAVALSSVTLRKMGIKIEVNLEKGLPKFYLDPQAIEQVLLNIITNAIQAMEGIEGPKQMEIRSFGQDPVTVTVSDSGPGVPQNALCKIFDPFYTTKGYGSGIGLSICHRIISDHGGTVKVNTSRFGGAEFRIEIPIAGKAKL